MPSHSISASRRAAAASSHRRIVSPLLLLLAALANGCGAPTAPALDAAPGPTRDAVADAHDAAMPPPMDATADARDAAMPPLDVTADVTRDGSIVTPDVSADSASLDATGSDAGTPDDASDAGCDPRTFVRRCDGTAALLVCPGGTVIRETCLPGNSCRILATGADCAVTNPTCDPATYRNTCTPDGRAMVCNAGRIVTIAVCGEGTVCVGVIAEDNGFQCADASRTQCDPATFVARCDGSHPIVCEPYGYVLTGGCESTNPLCVANGTHAACTFPGARTCADSTPCHADAPDFLFGCREGIDREYRIGCLAMEYVPCVCLATSRPSFPSPVPGAQCIVASSGAACPGSVGN